MLPAALKKQLSSVLQNGFVLKRAVFQPCLELYPMEEWEALMQRINKLNRFKKRTTILLGVLRLVLKSWKLMLRGVC